MHYFQESFRTDCSECYNYLLQIITPSSCFSLYLLQLASFVLSHLGVMSLFVRPLELHAERSIFGAEKCIFDHIASLVSLLSSSPRQKRNAKAIPSDIDFETLTRRHVE